MATSPGETGVVVAGAGAAGLSVAALLRRRGVEAKVIERSGSVASSWRNRYQSLFLNTPRMTSTLAGYRIPRRYGRYPTRAAMVEYLEEYARRHDLDIAFGTELTRVDRESADWVARTPGGDLRARHVVIATGHDVVPAWPEWPGRDSFTGELLHAIDYRDAEPFRRRDVLVVAPNTTGSEIAHELATEGAARVRVAMRTPPNVFPRDWLGVPLNVSATLLDLLPDRVADAVTTRSQRMIFGDLSRWGLPPSPIGAQTNTKVRHRGALVDNGFVDDLKRGRVEIVPAVEAFDGADVILSGGDRIQPDAVIAATGYRRGLEPIVGHLGVLDAQGVPTVMGDETHPNAPRLYFNGFYGTISGQLRYMRIHGRRIARTIAEDLIEARSTRPRAGARGAISQ